MSRPPPPVAQRPGLPPSGPGSAVRRRAAAPWRGHPITTACGPGAERRVLQACILQTRKEEP